MFFPPHDKVLNQNPPVPPRPQNQKAATMQVEASPENVQQLVEFLGVSKEEAERWLRVKKNDVNAASGAILDGEDLAKAESSELWSEEPWNTDRDGNNLHSLAATAPPSRAPSRAGDRLHPTSRKEEDEDYAAALANSQQDLRFSQEGGVVRADGSETKFGPATKESYDAYSWAMVPTSLTASEVIPDLPLERRKHTTNAPRALKQVPGAEYLSGLLMICHSIPAVREAMLLRDWAHEDYGEDEDWWKGGRIMKGKIVEIQEGGDMATTQDQKFADLAAEVQRIMAFLEHSDRTYAQPGALAHADLLDEAKAEGPSKLLVHHFLDQWAVCAGTEVAGKHDYFTLFNTQVVEECGANAERGIIEFPMIEIPVTIAEGEEATLTDLLDSKLWITGPNDTTDRDKFIQSAGDVLVMRLEQNDAAANQLRVTTPPTLHIDKYMLENAEATREVRRQRAQGKSKLSKIDQAVNRLSSWRKPFSNEKIDAKLLLSTTRAYYMSEEDPSADDGLVNGVSVDEGLQDTAAKLEQLIKNVDKKLAQLNALREETRRTIIGGAKDTAPIPGLEETNRYTLVGVSTKPNVSYILRAKADDDEDEIDQEDDGTPDGAEWWRIEYKVNATGSGATLDRSKIPGYDVIRAVELEHNSALLVYANDDAINHVSPAAPLPAPLLDFIARDNTLFHAELEKGRRDSINAPPAYELPANEVPRQSIERRTSMDSTRVEGGGSDDGMLDDVSPPGYGQPRILSQGMMDVDDDPPPHEIHLDDQEQGVEMVEKAPHAPLHMGGDAQMRDVEHEGWMQRGP